MRFVFSHHHMSTRGQRVFRVALLWAVASLLLLLLLFVYRMFGVGIPCPLNAVTGLHCPGCGMFRAVLALVRGDVWQAVRYNALCVFLLPAFAVFCVRESALYIRAALHPPTSRTELAFCISIVVLSMLYAVARNLPSLAALQPTSL